MDKIKELIESIKVNQGNFDYISHTGKINGSLLVELQRVLKEAIQYGSDWSFLKNVLKKLLPATQKNTNKIIHESTY